jgi:hypothetical protein
LNRFGRCKSARPFRKITPQQHKHQTQSKMTTPFIGNFGLMELLILAIAFLAIIGGPILAYLIIKSQQNKK